MSSFCCHLHYFLILLEVMESEGIHPAVREKLMGYLKDNKDATYAEAKELFPIISEYERGEVNSNVMRNIGLQYFAEFWDFMKYNDKFNPVIEGMTWRKSKALIAESTQNVRLKKFFMNRTQRQFNEILMDGPQFDRLLNGRWVSKPALTRRGRMSYGRRGGECIDGLKTCIIPLLNYIIKNNIDVYEDSKEYIYKKFVNQESIYYSIRWYTTMELKFDDVPNSELLGLIEQKGVHFSHNIRMKNDVLNQLNLKLKAILQVDMNFIIFKKSDTDSRLKVYRLNKQYFKVSEEFLQD